MPAKYPFKRTLYKGMKGRDVEVMQEWLARVNGFSEYTKKPIFIHGEFSQFTKWVLEDFQKSQGLKVTGIYDNITYQWLLRINYEAYAWEIGGAAGLNNDYWNN